MKKLISVLMAIVMIMGCLPVFAEAAAIPAGEWYVSYTITPEGSLTTPGDAGFTQTFVINEDGSCAFNMSVYTGQSNSFEGTYALNADGIYEMTFNGEVMFYANMVETMLVVASADGGMYYCTQDFANTQQVLPFNGYSAEANDSDFFGEWECGAVLYSNAEGGYDYYSGYMLDLDFNVTIGFDSQIGGYRADWYIGGVGEQRYNEEVISHAVYEKDEASDAYMYALISLSNGFSTTVFMYLDESGETLHVYGLYGILVFARKGTLQERPLLLEEVYAMYTEQEEQE